MEALFLKIVNMSITAGWVALAVMAVRLVFPKAPRRLLCLLWALVALRLVLPWSFESVLSLIPSTETLPQEFLYAAQPQIQSGIDAVDREVGTAIAQSLAPDPVASANPTQILSAVFAQLWLLGMTVMALYAIVSRIRLGRRVAASIGLGDGVYLCDYIDSPFILGVIRPGIYLPSTLEQTEVRHVLAHERAHLRRRDHLWKPLGFLLLTVHWFNPLMWLSYILLCRDMELACDEQVIRDLTAEEKKSYSMALLRCSVRRFGFAACPLAFGEVGVKERVKSVLRYKKPARWVVAVAVILCVVLGIGFLTDPVSGTVRDIINENGFVHLASYQQPVEITIPLNQLPPEAFTPEGTDFQKEEIVVCSTDTSTIYLRHARLEREGREDEQVNFFFDISYDLPKVGTILAPQLYCLHDRSIGNTASRGPEQQFGFGVLTSLLQVDSFSTTVDMGWLTYAKAGHEPMIRMGEPSQDPTGNRYETSGNLFTDPYGSFTAMTVDYADALAYLRQAHGLDPIDPFHYDMYKVYGAQAVTGDETLDNNCAAVARILDFYENSFQEDAPVSPAHPSLPDGTYYSGPAAFWSPLSSWYYTEGDITMVVKDYTVQIGNEQFIPDPLWQTECPLSDDKLAGFYEAYEGIDIIGITFDESCRYLPLRGGYFLMEKAGTLYLVNYHSQGKPLDIIWYIVEMVRA